MELRDIENLVRRWAQEGIADGRTAVFDELVAADVLDRSTPTPSRGAESFKARAGAVRAAFADIEMKVDDLVVEGDSIAWRWTLTGKHVGPFAGLAATGKTAALRGVNFQRIANGRVAEHWTLVDAFGALRALSG